MTDLVEQAVDRLRALPPEAQEDMARAFLQIMGEEQETYNLTPEEEAAVMKSRAAAARGEFATDEEVNAIRAQYRL